MPISTLPKVPSISSAAIRSTHSPRHHSLRPVFESGSGDGVIRGIDKAAEGDGNAHDEHDLFIGELEFLRCLRYGVKADKRPRRNGKGCKYRGKYPAGALMCKLAYVRGGRPGSHGFLLIKAPDRLHVHHIGLRRKYRRYAQSEGTDSKQRCQNGLNEAGLFTPRMFSTPKRIRISIAKSISPIQTSNPAI